MKISIILAIAIILVFLLPKHVSAALGDGSITNGTLSVSTQNAYGGAITSIKLNGFEFVRTSTHGASIQLAWQNNNSGECWNPTSDGTESDANKNSSTTQITSLTASNKSIEENFYPAYWILPGETDQYCNYTENPPAFHTGTAVNVTARTNTNVHQKISLDPENLANVVKLEDTITFGSTDSNTSLPLQYILAEQPAIFLLTNNLSKNYLYDDTDQSVSSISSSQGEPKPIIIATPDGLKAMGFYSNQVPYQIPTTWPQSIFTGYSTLLLNYPGENIWYLRVRLPYFVPPGKTKINPGDQLSTRTYLVFGTVTEVIGKLHQLYLLHPPLPQACLANAWSNKLEIADCVNVSGDLNADGKVDIFDYNILVQNFGKPYTIFDYNTLVENFGK